MDIIVSLVDINRGVILISPHQSVDDIALLTKREFNVGI